MTAQNEPTGDARQMRLVVPRFQNPGLDSDGSISDEKAPALIDSAKVIRPRKAKLNPAVVAGWSISGALSHQPMAQGPQVLGEGVQ